MAAFSKVKTEEYIFLIVPFVSWPSGLSSMNPLVEENLFFYLNIP